MADYRISRSVEGTLVDYISSALTAAGFTGFTVLKGFPDKYKGQTPFIGVEVLDRPVQHIEIGSTSIFLDIPVNIRIFALNDGQRLDVSDWLVDEKLLSSIDYYVYSNGGNDRELSGKMNLRNITSRKELTNTQNLVAEDRYRHLITATCRVSLS